MIGKLAPLPLEEINVGDASTSRIGCIIAVSDVFQYPSIIFGKISLQPRNYRKGTMVSTDGTEPLSKAQREVPVRSELSKITVKTFQIIKNFL